LIVFLELAGEEFLAVALDDETNRIAAAEDVIDAHHGIELAVIAVQLVSELRGRWHEQPFGELLGADLQLRRIGRLVPRVAVTAIAHWFTQDDRIEVRQKD